MKKLFINPSIIIGLVFFYSNIIFAGGYQNLFYDASQLGQAGAANTMVDVPANIATMPASLVFSDNIWSTEIAYINKKSNMSFTSQQDTKISTNTPREQMLGGFIYFINKNESLPIGIGAGIYEPFLRHFEWPGSWPYANTFYKENLKVIFGDFSLAYKVTPDVSISANLHVCTASWKREKTIKIDPLTQFNSTMTTVGQSLSGSVGLFIKQDNFAFGIHIRPPINIKTKGQVEYSVASDSVLPADYKNGEIKFNLTLPNQTNVSLAHYFTESKAMVELNLTQTMWSQVNNEKIEYSSGADPSMEQLNWFDTVQIAVGGYYPVWSDLKVSLGLRYEQSSISPKELSLLNPQASGTWSHALGVGYTYSWMKLNAAYMYQWSSSSESENTDVVTGKFDRDNHLMGINLSVVW